MPADRLLAGLSHANAAASPRTPEAAAKEFLRRIRKPAGVLVAISGGSDSTGLLIALARELHAFPQQSITLFAATVDHALRAESAAEALAVANLCATLGIAHRTLRWEGNKPATGIMAAAREARYGLLADAANELSADVIVTAHTFDDQRETLLMRSFRRVAQGGAAVTGIADAVLFDRRIWVVRPFLNCRREAVRDYLRREAVGWIDDPSNEDNHYERVRIRKELAGQPDAAFGAGEDGGSARERLSIAAAEWMAAHVSVQDGALCEIRPEGLAADAELLTYGLSALAAVLGGEAFLPGRDRMTRVLAFLAAGKPGRRTGSGVVFDLRKQGLFLMRESRGIAPLPLSAGETGVWDGRVLIANRGSADIVVEAAGPDAMHQFSADLPKGAVRRAAAAMPIVRTSKGEPVRKDSSWVEVSPYFAPFDRFLTRFDLDFANRMASTFARKSYLSLPFQGLLTENASGGADCLGNDTA